jgi:conjugative relaxase-like TrwC/TraI family protein
MGAMISHSKKSSTGGADGVVAYLTETEYLLAEQGKDGGTVWFAGKGAEALGLHDGMEITEISGAMKRMLNGQHPETGAALVQNGGDITKTRVMGHDFTVSPPKAFSLLYAMATPEEQVRLRQALAEANGAAMEYLGRFAQTRTGSASQGTIQFERADIVYSAHMHFASREQDPQLHIHNMLYNLTQGADGKWRTLETQAMLAARKDADRVAMAHLAGLVQSMGYAVESVDLLDRKGEPSGATTWSVAGMPKEMERAFSKRRQQIEAYIDAHPGASAQTACLETRAAKDEPPLATLAVMWREEIAAEAQAHGWKSTAEQYRTAVPMPAHTHDWRAWNLDGLVDAIHHQAKRSAVTLSNIEAAVAMHATAIDSAQTQQIAAEIAAEHFMDIGARGAAGAALSETQTLYVSHRWLAMERNIIGVALASRDDRYHAVDASEIDRQIHAFQQSKGFHMAGEQVAAIRHLAQDTGAVAVLEGLAGTGKTTSIVVAVNAWQSRGCRVIGVSTSESATRKLAEESGIEHAWNGAKLLDMIGRGQVTLTRNDVLIIDEAGMMDTKQAHAIMSAAQQAQGGPAKVVLMGDVRQLQSVGGGSPMGAVRDAISSAVLQNVRRQEGEHLIITKLLYGTDKDDHLRTDQETRTPDEIRAQSAAVIKEMEKQKMVAVHDTHRDAVRDIAQGFTSSTVPLDQRIVLAHTHDDREKLNAEIRPILRGQGVIQGDDHAVKQPGDRTLAVAIGDRITWDKNYQFRTERTAKGARVAADARTWAAHDKDGKALDQVRVVNGASATVEAIRAEKESHRITVRLHSDDKKIDGTRLSWLVQNTGAEKTPGFGHAYAVTVHRSQGQTMRDVYHLANASASNSAVLVAFTRIKTNKDGAYHLAGDAESIDALKNYAIGRLDVQRNALDIMKNATAWTQPPVAVPQPGIVQQPTLSPTPARGVGAGRGVGVAAGIGL